MLRTVAVQHEGHVYAGRVPNISATGAQLEGLWNVPEGTRVTIDLGDNQAVDAIARWSREDRLGVEFVQAINLSPPRAAPRSAAS